MSPRIQPRWQKDRNALNHDELKNKYLQTLERILAIVSGRSESAISIEETRDMLAIWPKRSVEAQSLINRFEVEMSPNILFRFHPLCDCSHETKEWMAPLIHGLWLARESVADRISQASECLARVDTAYQLAQTFLKNMSTLSVDAGAQIAIVHLRNACQDLTTAFSAFPHNIKAA